MSDLAKGPGAGFIFQFEEALLLLADLENPDDYISVEEVDDIASHSEDGKVLITVQAKHSISITGSTFEDTSYALWRTLQIWVEKLEKGIFNKDTIFTCCTNKKILNSSLLYRIKNNSFDDVFKEIEGLRDSQQKKLDETKKKDSKKGSSISLVLDIINFIVNKKDLFKKIHKNLQITDEVEARDKFYKKMRMNATNYTDLQKEKIYEAFYGWLIYNSKAKWKNASEARFTKQNFDDKFYQINTNPSIINAIFRTKKSLEKLGLVSEDVLESSRKEMFVLQIDDMKRNKEAKERIIKKAILDYVYSEIETSHIITKSDFTKEDFDEFLEDCKSVWQECFDEKITKEITEYSDEEKNAIAIDVYNWIMDDAKVKFNEGYSFDLDNRYLKNGSFLKLSNIPEIGWHPEWVSKYKKNEER